MWYNINGRIDNVLRKALILTNIFILIFLSVFVASCNVAYADEIDMLREEIKQEREEERLKELEELENIDEYQGPTLEEIQRMEYGSWSGLSVEQLEKGLLYDLKPLAEAYITAEKTYNVNAVLKAAQDAYESSWGRCCFSKNNISGFFTEADFWSKEECIYYVASKLEAWYIQPPHEECNHENCEIGQFYNGRTIYDVSINYCPTRNGDINYDYANEICNIAYDIYRRALEE